MSTVKVIEVLSESEKSWEDAAQSAIDKSAESLHKIRSLYIKELEARVDNGKICQYRINAKISFELD